MNVKNNSIIRWPKISRKIRRNPVGSIANHNTDNRRQREAIDRDRKGNEGVEREQEVAKVCIIYHIPVPPALV